MTGQMGDVMKESAQIALTYVRSVASDYGVKENYFEKHDIHLHIPEGAVPKDGPSAGITMATAMLSAVTGRKVLPRVAMTGEVTMRGHADDRRSERKTARSPHGAGGKGTGTGEKSAGCRGTFEGNHERNGDRIHQGDERSHPRGICTGEIAV